jgi:hypothetical protein
MPYTGVVLAFLAIHLAVFLILLGHWVAAAGMFPQAARSFARVYDQRPTRALLVGIFTYGPILLLFLGNARIHNGPLRALVFVAMGLALLIALVGSGGLALRIGRNLSPEVDMWRQALRGGVMLALVFITPLLGWFMISLGLASGFGAFFLARPWKSKTPPLPVQVPASASPATQPPVPSLS